MFLFTLCFINALVLLSQHPKYASPNLENNIRKTKTKILGIWNTSECSHDPRVRDKQMAVNSSRKLAVAY